MSHKQITVVLCLILQEYSFSQNGGQAVGPETVQGVGNNPPYTYAFSPVFSTTSQVALLSQAAMKGGNGSWAVRYGATPLSTGTLHLAAVVESR